MNCEVCGYDHHKESRDCAALLYPFQGDEEGLRQAILAFLDSKISREELSLAVRRAWWSSKLGHEGRFRKLFHLTLEKGDDQSLRAALIRLSLDSDVEGK